MGPMDPTSEWILCKVCGFKSYNKADVMFKYCKQCHMFHEIRPYIKPSDFTTQQFIHIVDIFSLDPFPCSIQGTPPLAEEFIEM